MLGCIDREHIDLYFIHVTGRSICPGKLETKHQSPRQCTVIGVLQYVPTPIHGHTYVVTRRIR
jgi:hypothetical protein